MGVAFAGSLETTPGEVQEPAAATGELAAFAMRLNATGTEVVYATYPGGSAIDTLNALAVDFERNAYVAWHSTIQVFPCHTRNLESRRSGDSVSEKCLHFRYRSQRNGGASFDFVTRIALARP